MSPKNASQAYEEYRDLKICNFSVCAPNCDLSAEPDRARQAVQENDGLKRICHFGSILKKNESAATAAAAVDMRRVTMESTDSGDVCAGTTNLELNSSIEKEIKSKGVENLELQHHQDEVLQRAARLGDGGMGRAEPSSVAQQRNNTNMTQNHYIQDGNARNIANIDAHLDTGASRCSGRQQGGSPKKSNPFETSDPTGIPSTYSSVESSPEVRRNAQKHVINVTVKQHSEPTTSQEHGVKVHNNHLKTETPLPPSNTAASATNVRRDVRPYPPSLQRKSPENSEAATRCTHFVDVLCGNAAAPEAEIKPTSVACSGASDTRKSADKRACNYAHHVASFPCCHGAAEVHEPEQEHGAEAASAGETRSIECNNVNERVIVSNPPATQTHDAPPRCRGRRAREKMRQVRLAATTLASQYETEGESRNAEDCSNPYHLQEESREERAQDALGQSILDTAVPPPNHAKECVPGNTTERISRCYCDDCMACAEETVHVAAHRVRNTNEVRSNPRKCDIPTCMEVVPRNKETSNEVGVLLFKVKGNDYVALLDPGASQSFMTPSLARVFHLSKRRLKVPLEFSVANGASMRVFEIVPNVQLELEQGTFTGDFLVAPVPYDALIGMDWLKQHKAIWDIGRGLLTLYNPGRDFHRGIQVPVKSQLLNGPQIEIKDEANHVAKDPAEEAHEAIVQELQRLSPEEAAALVRPSPKRTKGWKNLKRKINVRHLTNQSNNQHSMKAPIVASLCQIGVISEQSACEVTQQSSQPQNGVVHLDPNTNGCQWQQTAAYPMCKTPEFTPINQQPGSYTFNKGQLEVMFLLNQQSQRLSPANGNQGSLFEYNSIGDDDNEESTWGKTPTTHNKFDEWFKTNSAHLPQEIRDVLLEFRSVFPDSLPQGLPPKRYVDHRIILVPGKLPPKAPLYRMSAEHIKAQKQELDLLLERGWIGPTSSPFCAPTMMVSKKQDAEGNPQYRMVINYIELNKITIAPDFPLPNISTILELLGGAKVFTTLDLEAGFNQIRVAKGDRWKTAFRSLLGLYESKVMPFGLKGAPATFQANVNYYLRPFLGRGVIAYLDDILIYSPDAKSHAELLRGVLTILLRERFYPKFSKCRFGLTSLEYLGYHICGDGISPSEDKVLAIKNWPETLENDTQVRQFLGTVNYCRMFMGPRFADLARPLVELTKKDVRFHWNEEHTEAVRALKNKLVNYTMLQVPDLQKPFVLHTDASSFAVGAVLEQEGRPVGFLSKTMSPTEQRYSVYDQELLALVSALTKWRHLLLGAKVTAYTDHKALTYINKMNQSKPVRGRLSRWMDFIADFKDLTIVYKEGKCNNVADAMSRNPIHSSELTQSPVVMAILGKPGGQKRSRQADGASSSLPMHEYSEEKPAKQPRTEPKSFLTSRNTRLSTEHTEKQPETAETPVITAEIGEEVPLEPDRTLRRTSYVDLSIRPFSGASWLAAYDNCEVFSEAYREALVASPNPVEVVFNKQRLQFKLTGHFLYVKIQGLWRICVPSRPEFRCYVLYQHHDHPTAGHMGQRKTYQSLARQYYWPGIHDYCRRYVESCVACRTSKASSLRTGGLLQPLIIPSRR